MCGINGVFAYGGGVTVDLEAMRLVRDHMTPRGPDGFGEWSDVPAGVAFGHRRLAIIDLSATGAQPMTSADGRLVVTFNGEIYNFQTLRDELEAAGHVFQSRSDTEVLLHLYRRDGANMVQRLRGMFAFAIWDAERRCLFLARDPYGIKPLYYADDGKSIRFASSVKALIAGGEVPAVSDPAGLVGFHLFGSVPEPWTIYKSIKSLPAGSSLMVDRSGLGRPRAYFSLAETYAKAEANADKAIDVAAEFRAAVLDSVRHHLVSDVPVGAFLSAGVDSGALLGLMRDAGQTDIHTVTLAFEAFRGRREDESGLAAAVAERYGATHTTRWVDEREFRDDLPKIVAAMDQPSIDGVNTWFVSKATREQGLKVALSGVGGDELLGGYSTFARLPRMARAMRFVPRLPGLGTASRAVVAAARTLGARLHPKAASAPVLGGTIPGAYLMQRGLFLPAEMREAMRDPDVAEAGLAELRPLDVVGAALSPSPRGDFARVATLESSFYLRNQLLRDTDWAGMAHSLEIRTPLVDSFLLERVAPLFAGALPPNGKSLLAGAPTNPLPDEIVNRDKTGFGVPLRDWFEAMTPGRVKGDEWSRRLWSREWARHALDLYGLGRA